MSSDTLLRLVLTVFLVALCIAGGFSQCYVDSSVSDKDKHLVEDVIKMLEPLQGTKVTVNDGVDVSYTVAFCSEASKAFKNTSVLETDGSSASLVVGLKNRTLAQRGAGWLELQWLSHRNYSNASLCSGHNHSAVVLLVCDASVTAPSDLRLSFDPPAVVGSECYSHFSGRHSVACDGMPSQGLGGFSIFLIIVVVCFGAYFVLGFAYLRFIKSAKGVDQIPHREFWFKVGNTFADCANGVCRCDKYCGAGVSGEDYTAVAGDPTGYSSLCGATMPGGGAKGGGGGGYHGGYSQVPGSFHDREELLAPHRAPVDADLIQP